MKNSSTYKGRTLDFNKSLFDNMVTVEKPKKSGKFPNALYYDGKHYFLENLKPSTREGKPYEIQAVFYSHKWHQDTFYITEELKNILESAN